MSNWLRSWMVVVILMSLVCECKRHERQIEQPGKLESAGKNFSINRGQGLGVWKLKYGENDRLVGIMLPDNREIEYSYDTRGNLCSLVSGRFKEKYEYDFFNFLNKISDSTGETLLKRDFKGELIEMVYPDGNDLKYEYEGTGRVRSVTWGERHYLKFFRDLLGNMIRLESPAGAIKIQYDYDQGLMERIFPNGARSLFEFNKKGRPGLIRHVGPGGNVLLEFRYVYDDVGLLKSAVETTLDATVNIFYFYDEYDQLVKAEYSDGRVYTYEYDDGGNCVKYSSPTGIQTACYDENDRLVSLNGEKVVHDRCGNLISIGGTGNYFNVKNLLESDGKNSYRYNALNLRLESLDREGKSHFVHFLDDLPYVLAETGKMEKCYLWADGHCLGEVGGDHQVLFYFEDQLGSIRGAIDGQGRVIGEAEFSPFGVPLKRIKGVRFGYTGEEQDEDGKVYLRERYYLPQVGRFISMDLAPLQLTDSIKQNCYIYAANSPVNYKDSDGTYPDSSWWNNFTSGRYLGTGFGEYAAQKWADKYVQTNNPIYSLFGLMASLWTKETYMKTVLTLSGSWGVSSLASGSIPRFITGFVEKNIGRPSLSEPFYLNLIGKFVHYGMGRFGPHIGISTGGGKAFLHIYSNYINIGGSRGFNIGTFILPGIIDVAKSFFQGIGVSETDNKKNVQLSFPIVPPKDSEYRKYFISFPPDDWNGGGGAAIDMFDPPNVGGVYLDKAAQIIGQLSGIEGVAFEPNTNRVILFGNDAGKTDLPPLRIEDLAAAFRSVFGDYDTEPGVTIDPDPKNPKGEQMMVRFFGGMENTYFGYQLFEADRMMKSLSLGKDNISGKPVKANIEGYYNQVDLGFSNMGGKCRQELWSRFWLVPEQVIVRVSDDKKSITFPDTRIRIKTETMRWQGGQLIPVKGERDEKAEYFAAHFTRYYDNYAKEFPIYRNLKTLANLVGLAKWLKEASINVNFEWIKDYEKSFGTPTKTPSLTVSDRRSSMEISVFGGTDLTVQNAYVKDDGSSAKIAQDALKALIAEAPGLATVNFRTNDGKFKRAVALPTAQTRAGGAKIMRDAESGLFERIYCSFHNEQGPFGYSWFLDVPHLVIGRPEKGKVEHVMVGNHKVIVRDFRFVGPFGRPDVVFGKPTVDEQYEKIAFLPINNRGIRALYADEEKKEFRVEYSDDRASVFNSLGYILRQEKTLIDYLQYTYDQSNRLISINQIYQDKMIDQAIFSYDKQGRIESAHTNNGIIHYEYNLKGDLEKISTPNFNIGYTYNDRHLVTSVIRNGKAISMLEYDEFGRILSEKITDGNLFARTIRSNPGKTEIIEKIGNRTVEQVYDAGGRLLQWQDDSSGFSVKADYDEFGSKKSEQWQNNKGEAMKVEYSPDGRYVSYIFPDGEKRAYLYDEYGRLKQVQDQKYAILNQEYNLTNRGWYEGIETAEIKMQSFFNKNKEPIEKLLTSKMPDGGFLKLENTFTNDGNLRLTQIQGLFNHNYQYKQGRLASIATRNGNINLDYDTADRINSAISPDRQINFTYDEQGRVSRIQERSKGGEVIYEFSNGLLSQRKTLSGRVDIYGWNKNGQIINTSRGSRENWQIRYDPRRISILRNGQVIEESLYDDKGRLIEILR